MRRRWFVQIKTILLVGLLGLLAGCANLNLPALKQKNKFSYLPPKVRRKAGLRLAYWRITGAFSFKEPGRADVANFRWTQLGRNNYSIQMSSSLSVYNIMLDSKYGGVTLWASGHHPVQGKSPEALLKREVGWSIPISAMRYWVRGIPAPGKFQAKYDEFGHVTELQQKGWDIQFSKYRNFTTSDVPRLLKMRYPARQIQLKVAIKTWQNLMVHLG